MSRIFLDWLAAMNESTAMGELARLAVNQFPTLDMLEAGAPHHMAEAMDARHPPVRLVLAVLLVRIEFHHHLVALVSLAKAASIGRVIVTNRRFYIDGAVTD